MSLNALEGVKIEVFFFRLGSVLLFCSDKYWYTLSSNVSFDTITYP